MKDRMMSEKSAAEPAWMPSRRGERAGGLAPGNVPGGSHAEI